MRSSLLFYFIALWLVGCTNFKFRELQDRVEESLSGELGGVDDIDPPGTDSFSFVVVGDTHVGNAAGQIYADRVQAISDLGVAFVVVAGDVSQAGLQSELESFIEITSLAGLSFRAAIGNHDIYFGGWDRWRSVIGRSLYSFNADNVHFSILDSANGVLGERQLEWLKNDLASATQTHKVVVSHYPPWIGKFSSMFKMGSEEEAAILKDILSQNNVNFMFSGHYHGYDEIVLGATTYVVTGGMNNLIDPGQSKNFVRVSVEGSSIRSEVIFF